MNLCGRLLKEGRDCPNKIYSQDVLLRQTQICIPHSYSGGDGNARRKFLVLIGAFVNAMFGEIKLPCVFSALCSDKIISRTILPFCLEVFFVLFHQVSPRPEVRIDLTVTRF